MYKNIANIILFQISWFACVLGGNLIGVVVGSLVLIIHMLAISRNPRELYVIGLGALIGCTADQILVMYDILIPHTQMKIIPGSLVMLWLCFMTCPNHSLSWLKKRPWLASVCGAVFGPLSYHTGMRLGAIGFGNQMTSLLAISLIWAAFLPLAFGLSHSIIKK